MTSTHPQGPATTGPRSVRPPLKWRLLGTAALVLGVALVGTACDPSDPSTWTPEDVAQYLNLHEVARVSTAQAERTYAVEDHGSYCHATITAPDGTVLYEGASADACHPEDVQLAEDSVTCYFVDRLDGRLKRVVMGFAEFRSSKFQCASVASSAGPVVASDG